MLLLHRDFTIGNKSSTVTKLLLAIVDHINKDQADTLTIMYCKTLSKHIFEVNLDDKGAAVSSDISQVLPHPNNFF